MEEQVTPVETSSPLSSGGTSSILQNKEVDLQIPTQKLPFISSQDGTPKERVVPQQADSRTRNAHLLDQYMTKALVDSKDEYKYQKVYSYNPEATGDKQNQNFQRYYQHSSYDKLGFNPWRDNEGIYNQQGTKAGELWRATKAGAKLMYTGFTSPLRSYADLFSGNPGALDYKSAQEMAQQNTVGASSRGGVTGFTSNLFTNGGYTLGIIAETVAEGIVASALTGGTSLPGTLGRAGIALRNLGKAETYTKAVAGMLDALKSFDASKILYSAIKGGVNLVNPLENTFKAFKEIKASENLTALVKASHSAGAFYRDVRLANLVASESKIEGASVAAELKQSMMDKYYSDHRDENGNGVAATGKEYERILQLSQEAGERAMYANLPAIFLTDKITFDGLFKPFKSLDGVYTKTGRALNFVKNEGFDLVKPGIVSAAKGLIKPKLYGKAAINYFKGNFAEGLQESVQEVISGATKDYYMDLYNNKSKQGLDYVHANIGKQFSGQGFETFASGFFMGGLFGAGGKALHAANVGRLKVQDRFALAAVKRKDAAEGTNKAATFVGKYAAYVAQKEKYAEQDKTTLNELYKDPLKYFGAGIIKASNTTLSQEGKTEAERNNDQKTWQDLDNQEVWGHITTALDTDTYSIFMDHLDDISKMDKKSITDAYGVDGEEALSKINKIKERAEKIKEAYDVWNVKAPNPHNPSAYKKDTPEYRTEAIAFSAWNNAKNHAVFYNYSYDRNKERIKSIVNTMSQHSPTADMTLGDLQPMYDNIALSKELTALQQEITTLRGGIGNSAKKDLNQKIRKQKLLRSYRDAVRTHFINQSVGQAINESGKEAPTVDTHSPLKTAYENYIKYLAKQKKVEYSQPAINSTFEQVKDVHKLGIDNVNLMGAVNHLADPKGFYDYYDRLNKTFTDLYNQREEYIARSVKAVQERVELNAVLQGLYDRGIVIGAEDLNALANKGEIPKEFYDVAGKQVVNKNHPNYETYVAVTKTFLEVNGKLKPEEKPVEPVVAKITELEAKKADIEKRRKTTADTFRLEDGKQKGFYEYYLLPDGSTEEVYGKDEEEVRSLINAKYDAELAALDVVIEDVKQAEEKQAIALEKFDLQGRLDAVKNEDELTELSAVVSKAAADGTLPPIDGYFLFATNAIEAKYIELFSKVDISTLKKGMVVTLKNEKMQNVQIKRVNSKNGKLQIEGFYVNGLPIQGDNRYITKDDIKYTAHMKGVKKTTVTAEEKELIKTNQKTGVDFASDQAKAAKVLDNADKKTTAQVTEDFLNKLGCKK